VREMAGASEPWYFSMAALLLFFALSLVLSARYLNRALAESFRLRFESASLIANLKEETVVREKTEDHMHVRNNILKMLATGHTLTEVLNDINRIIYNKKTVDSPWLIPTIGTLLGRVLKTFHEGVESADG